MIETPFTEFMRVFLAEVRNATNYWKQIEAILKETTSAPAASTASAKQKKKGAKIVLHKNDQEIWQHVYNLCVAIGRHITLSQQFVKNVLAVIASNKNDNLQLPPFQLYFEQLNEPKATDASPEETDKTGREWDIYPTMDELMDVSEENYVKANVVKGRFNSVDHYLGVQLSLLREDFIAPLRDGIHELIKQSTKDDAAPVELQSNLNIRVYPTVRIMIIDRERFDKSNFKSEHLLVDLEPQTRKTSSNQLDGSPSPFNSGKYAKKLMFGSLLCFSSSQKFDDLIIAVVSNRDVEMLNLGFVSYFVTPTPRMYFISFCFISFRCRSKLKLFDHTILRRYSIVISLCARAKCISKAIVMCTMSSNHSPKTHFRCAIISSMLT